MRLVVVSIIAALAMTGCGSSSGTSSSGLSGQSTCGEWNAATTQSKHGYLASKNVETGKGSPGDAISAWMDYLCGKTNPSTSFSTLTAIDDVFPTAQQQFTNGPTYPPVANKTKTAQ